MSSLATIVISLGKAKCTYVTIQDNVLSHTDLDNFKYSCMSHFKCEIEGINCLPRQFENKVHLGYPIDGVVQNNGHERCLGSLSPKNSQKYSIVQKK